MKNNIWKDKGENEKKKMSGKKVKELKLSVEK